jgi:hypothetical protein
VALGEVVEARSAGKMVEEVDRVGRRCRLVRELELEAGDAQQQQQQGELPGDTVVVEARHAVLKVAQEEWRRLQDAGREFRRAVTDCGSWGRACLHLVPFAPFPLSASL